ncbi:MAG TPA: response regulator [Terriglobales bacterium]|nr:response regulator [Terriglobales bacterium]
MPKLNRTTILCIDDDETGLLIRKMMLEQEGYRVFTATSGQEGLRLLASGPVDAIILDYQMPPMNGAEVARLIRQKWPDVPIVMLSGFPDEVPEDALKLVNAFVIKGGAPEQLLVVVQDTLAGRSFGRITILNVDDNEQSRYAISRVLRKAGFNVLEARTGREALDVASARPSLIILDINLPDMLGFDVCRHLKADPVTRDIPVIHISATYPADTAHGESSESGAGRFMEHPEDLVEVVEVVRDELRRTGRL